MGGKYITIAKHIRHCCPKIILDSEIDGVLNEETKIGIFKNFKIVFSIVASMRTEIRPQTSPGVSCYATFFRRQYHN